MSVIRATVARFSVDKAAFMRGIRFSFAVELDTHQAT